MHLSYLCIQYMNDEKNLVDVTECVCANSLDTPEDTCISAQVQGRDISSERTLKVGISHSSVSRFPLVFFIHDK